ncbi:MAG: response regulator [Pirellulales bacterium]|jgi:DNA-binding NarL/FixJ family response regulator
MTTTTVALVEDDMGVRSSLCTLLGSEPGLSCTCTCATGEEAVRKVPEAGVDVVVMDIKLPGMSGIECARRLKERCPHIAILMLTVYDETDLIFDALRAGAGGYLLKRAATTELVHAIRDVLDGGAPMTAHVARRVVDYFREPMRPAAAGAAAADRLTDREQEIVEHLSRGYSNREIADTFGIGVPTVRTHLRSIYSKLHVRSRTQAALKYRGQY